MTGEYFVKGFLLGMMATFHEIDLMVRPNGAFNQDIRHPSGGLPLRGIDQI